MGGINGFVFLPLYTVINPASPQIYLVTPGRVPAPRFGAAGPHCALYTLTLMHTLEFNIKYFKKKYF